MGWTMTILEDTMALPFESVEVTGNRTASWVVGRIVAGAGEGFIMILFDAGAGSSAFTGLKTASPFTTGTVVVVGINLGAGERL